LPPGNFPLVSKGNSRKPLQGFKTSKSKCPTENTFIISISFLLQALNQNKMLLIRDRVIEWLVNYISGQNYDAAFVNKTPTFLIDFGSSGIIPSKYRVDFSQNKINNRVGANLLREYCRDISCHIF
jgi:hypothetical protein